MPLAQSDFHKKILVCNTDFYLYREMQMGLADYRNDHRSWEFIVDECWPDHCYNGRAADGAVVSIMSKQMLESWQRFSGPLVNVSHSISEYPFPSIYSDDFKVGQLAADHFLERSYENFAFFGSLEYAHSRQRLGGFEFTLQGNRKSGPGVSVYEQEPGKDFFKNLFTRRLINWLDSLPKPVAILASDDPIASRLIEFMVNNGIRVPEDVAVLGVNDDERICMMSRVPLSSVPLDGYRIGYRAGELLHLLLSGASTPGAVELVPPKLVSARHSTDMVASQDPILRRGISFIRNHLSEPITVEDVSRYAGCSRRVLERHFGEHFGHGPYEEILVSRISRAKQYLGYTDKTVEEISVICGFSEPNLFYTQFRKREGTSPREWRKDQLSGQRKHLNEGVKWPSQSRSAGSRMTLGRSDQAS